MADQRNLIDPAEIGRKGGLSRAKNMSAEARSASAKKAARARWGEKKAGKGKGKPKLTAPSKRGTSAK